MSRLLAIMATFAGFIVSAPAQEETFQKAQTAYDDGRYAEASLLYGQLLEDGVDNMEVHFNLANAAFKDSDLPTAVQHYRTAWYETPRDPDIEANLRFALNAAGATVPNPGFTGRVLASLTRNEWMVVGVAGYLLLLAMLGLMLIMKQARKNLVKLCTVPVTLLLLSAGGWRYWHALAANPEWVVVKKDATALFGPVEGTTAHYKLPLAALVRQTDTDPKGWIEVEYDGKRGWLKQSDIRRVCP